MNHYKLKNNFCSGSLAFFYIKEMQPLDIGILLFGGLGIFAGYRKGFLYQFASFLGLIVGLLVAKKYYSIVAKELSPTIFESMTVAQMISFIGIWVIVPIVFSFFASLISGLINKIYLGWINRLLGALIGIIKYLFLLSILICVFDFLDSENSIISETKKDESVLYKPVKSITRILFFAVKDVYLQKEEVDGII